MIDVIAKRRTTLNGKQWTKGEAGQMPLAQFTDLEPTGRFERAPKPKAEPEATPSKSSASAD